MQYQLGPPPMNPLARLLAAIVGAVALVGAFFFGFFILIAVVTLGLVAWLVIWLRVWWIKRKLASAGGTPPPGFGEVPPGRADGDKQSGDVLDAEYEVVSRSEENE